ncbi:MAG: M23 family metallopeptidase, partial [Desulfobulbia bacterium]
SHQFFRFRTPDGIVDYYDENGSSSKKFLMRKPARGARLTSGFGYRVHPIKRIRKMHFGVDWAAKRGTPVLAAGNGVIETAERKRGYGNFVSIRHANGYKTAYGHMYRIAKGIRPGVKVRQGQIIGAVGSTGYSTGNHLHYEVMVNNRHVNPMKIEVPRGRKLKGRLLADFQKERKRINQLMRRAPVKTRVAEVQEN